MKSAYQAWKSASGALRRRYAGDIFGICGALVAAIGYGLGISGSAVVFALCVIGYLDTELTWNLHRIVSCQREISGLRIINNNMANFIKEMQQNFDDGNDGVVESDIPDDVEEILMRWPRQCNTGKTTN